MTKYVVSTFRSLHEMRMISEIKQIFRGTLTPLSDRFSAASKKMSSVSDSSKDDHLHRTQDDFRQNTVTPAVVSSITQISDTVKGLTLKVNDSNVSFKAGQWVDFFIPTVTTVGGFSMCSTPKLLTSHKMLTLAVKFSRHPPAFWVHKKCKVDSQVSIRVGGNFYYDPKPSDPTADILLIAGGVGINPLYAMLLHVADLHEALAKGENVHKPGKVTMLYSARSEAELIFKDDIVKLCQNVPNIHCEFFVTKETQSLSSVQDVSVGRINESKLKSALADMNKENLKCYICGPPPMISSMEEYLVTLGVTKTQIAYEKWW
ncbi:oxidoreductase NAD-binding domain-containing protein 1-like isoform X2 [Ptychodera flava]|uniref:oxidoreductase NAD-binding domain-containing protein 1-like isoform X2 n=1 Tax=Ptychodera flava TaxID=63121 RepID=UPI00396A571E